MNPHDASSLEEIVSEFDNTMPITREPPNAGWRLPKKTMISSSALPSAIDPPKSEVRR